MSTQGLDELAAAAAKDLLGATSAATDITVRRAELDRLRRRRRGVRALGVMTVAVLLAVTVVGVAVRPSQHAQPVPPADHHPTRFAGLPPVGAALSQPATGRLLVNVTAPSAVWNVYADGRIIWQRWTHSGDATVIPKGADPLATTYVQQQLTPQGARELASKILAAGQHAGLFSRSISVVDPKSRWASYQVCNAGALNYVQVDDVAYISHEPTATPAQLQALAQITRMVSDASRVVTVSDWTDRTIRPYIPSRYLFSWERAAPDPTKLASPAREALQRLLDASGGHAAGSITTDQTRALLDAFTHSGVKIAGNHSSGWSFELPTEPGAGIPTTIIGFRPAAPSSALSNSNRC